MTISKTWLAAIGALVAFLLVGAFYVGRQNSPAVGGSEIPSVSEEQARLAEETTATSTNGATTTQKKPSTTQSSVISTRYILIDNYAFKPGTITVKRGSSVVWVNKDGAAHTVTGDNGRGPASGQILQGQSYTYTFKTAGTFPYFCKFHTSMRGTIVVN